MKVLVLAGTTEARRLSQRLATRGGTEVIVSLAGLTSRSADHGATVRTGGFGGAEGLASVLRDEGIDVVVDATHPFATTMPRHAAQACEACGVPRLRLVRPPWVPGPGDRWTEVPDLQAAAGAVRGSRASRVLLTTGRLELAPFARIPDVSFVLRTIEAPDERALPGVEVIRARGPFTVADEVELATSRGIELIVTKNAGGDDAKLVAARQLGLPVVVVRRPPAVAGPAAATVDEALAWLEALPGG